MQIFFVKLYDINTVFNSKMPYALIFKCNHPTIKFIKHILNSYVLIVVISVLVIRAILSWKCYKYPIYKFIVSLFCRKARSYFQGFPVADLFNRVTSYICSTPFLAENYLSYSQTFSSAKTPCSVFTSYFMEGKKLIGINNPQL